MVATRKVSGLEGLRLLVVQPVTEAGVDRGAPVVAADTTQAGPGDLVHLTSPREAAVALPEPFVPWITPFGDRRRRRRADLGRRGVAKPTEERQKTSKKRGSK